MTALSEFIRKKDFLVCVDSDGCAMDTMDIKHVQCFGPCMIEEWGLQMWKEKILRRWNEINLYTMTRGSNRFKGLAMALGEINQNLCPIEGIEEFVQWVDLAPELSNFTVERAAKSAKGSCFVKACSWSQKVNAGINLIPEHSKRPFDHVKEGLAAAHTFADVAVVSSANKEAVIQEWKQSGLLDNVDVLCCQESGCKAHCISFLKKRGYAPDHILMVGDAPGDHNAAKESGVYYFPILVGHESQSWLELKELGIRKFQDVSYEAYGEEKTRQFFENLGSF